MLLMDEQNRGIASADTQWTPLGASVPVKRGAASELMMFAGRKYLVRIFPAEGYPGYQGPLGCQVRACPPPLRARPTAR